MKAQQTFLFLFSLLIVGLLAPSVSAVDVVPPTVFNNSQTTLNINLYNLDCDLIEVAEDYIYFENCVYTPANNPAQTTTFNLTTAGTFSDSDEDLFQKTTCSTNEKIGYTLIKIFSSLLVVVASLGYGIWKYKEDDLTTLDLFITFTGIMVGLAILPQIFNIIYARCGTW